MKQRRYFRNDPFWLTAEAIDASTDRELYEEFYLAYEKPEVTEKVKDYETRLAAIEAMHAEKPLAVRKAEFWDYCKDFGCKDEREIQRQWDEYLKG